MPRPTLALTLQTKVGRRIVLLFVIGALLPVAAFAVLGFVQVRRHLVERTRAELASAAKDVGMGVLDRLGEVLATLRVVGEVAGRSPDALPARGERVRDMFGALAVRTPGATDVWWGAAPPEEALSREAETALSGGQPTVVVAGRDTHTVWIVVPLRGGRRLWGAPTMAALFGGAADRAEVSGAEVTLCIRDRQDRALYCPPSTTGDGPLATESWEVFLGYDYAAPAWQVSVSLPMREVLAPARAFRRTFGATVILVLGLVVLLSVVQVRRSLQPLTELRRGTLRLAGRDFSGTVRVASGDEFEELATSFNDMAGELDRQFRTLTAVTAIDQAALTSARGEEIAATAAVQLLHSLRGAAVDVCVAGPRPTDPWRIVRAEDGSAHDEGTVVPTEAELGALRAAARTGLVRARDDGFAWLGMSAGPVVIVPLLERDELLGLVAVHSADGGPSTDELLRATRQVADKVAVGLSNGRLIVRLDQLSYGALAALARTVDASSHWTAGHSERVTACSLRMALRLGLPEPQRDTLHRGGLLHDIGKIGIPPDILDKAGPLEAPEMARIREHPALGAKILAPLAAFSAAIPIVRSHHEKFDGSGYPDGLRGEAIPYLARLLAVADVYDALVSSRPYRSGWAQDDAIRTIRETTGSHFDPAMVAVFLEVLAEEGDAARFSLSLDGSAA